MTLLMTRDMQLTPFGGGAVSNYYFYRPNKDSGNAFIQALNGAGYERIDNINRANFLLMDHDDIRYQPEYKNAIETKPLFVYPHTPYSWFIWDGILRPKKIACNFVVGNGAKEAMRLYGYPHRVESVGFAGVNVQEFQPTQGTKLLFAPAHPIHNGKYPTDLGFRRTQQAAQWVVQHLGEFESITVRWHGNTLEQAGLAIFNGLRAKNLRMQKVDVYATPNIRQDALQAIDATDLVISQSTLGYLSVARGKPTIFYGYSDGVLDSREGNAQHSDLYKHIWYYPLVLECMNIKEVLNARASDESIRTWKQLNIGENFNADKFLSIVHELFI